MANVLILHTLAITYICIIYAFIINQFCISLPFFCFFTTYYKVKYLIEA